LTVDESARVEGARCQRAFIFACLGLLASLAVVLWLTREWDEWRHPALIAAFALLALASVTGEVRFARFARFGLIDPLVLLAVVVCGPMAGFLAMLLPDLATRVGVRRSIAITPGASATYLSYGWSTVALAGVLALAHMSGAAEDSPPAVVCAGIAWAFVNWTLARAFPARLWSGQRIGPMLRSEYLATLPAQISMVGVAALLIALMPVLGEAGMLALLAPLVLGAQALLPWLARSSDISKRDPAAATAIYVRALAGYLRLPRAQRRIALAVVELERRAAIWLCGAPRSERGWLLERCSAPLPPAPVGLRWTAAQAHEVWLAELHRWERWDGTGGPSGARGDQIPLASRLVAVAAEWAQLTAAGGPKLSQDEAALALGAEAGTRLDPALVRAAGEIIATEEQFADIDRFEPRLHLLPLPAAIRRGLLPRALRAYAAV
jgi:hypothetical protein